MRVDTQRLDDIMNMVGELVLVRNRLSTLKTTMADEELANAGRQSRRGHRRPAVVGREDPHAAGQEGIRRFRAWCATLPRNPEEGRRPGPERRRNRPRQEPRRGACRPARASVRNAVDHGIESPEDREKSGKHDAVPWSCPQRRKATTSCCRSKTTVRDGERRCAASQGGREGHDGR